MTIEVLRARSGGLTLARVAGAEKTFLQSSYDPLDQARKLVAKAAPPSTAAFIVVGVGLGQILEILPERSLVAAFEPSVEVHSAAVAAGRDPASMAARRGGELFVGPVDPEKIAPAFSRIADRPIVPLVLATLAQIDPRAAMTVEASAASVLGDNILGPSLSLAALEACAASLDARWETGPHEREDLVEFIFWKMAILTSRWDSRPR